MQKILVVDDNRDAADTTAALLRLDGEYDIRVAYNGLDAVAEARRFGPHLVVLDINMPVMNGYDAARILRTEQRAGERLVLVALTGRTQIADRKEAREAGFDHHLGKPVPADELLTLVASCLTSPSTPSPGSTRGAMRR